MILERFTYAALDKETQIALSAGDSHTPPCTILMIRFGKSKSFLLERLIVEDSAIKCVGPVFSLQ
jgi:hypothetical protein